MDWDMRPGDELVPGRFIQELLRGGERYQAFLIWNEVGTIGPHTDVWGVGVTIYQAASKQLPFPRGTRGGTDDERWPQLTREPAPLPGRVGRGVAEVVMSCPERDPARRPTTWELFDAFDELAGAQGRHRRRLRWRSA